MDLKYNVSSNYNGRNIGKIYKNMATVAAHRTGLAICVRSNCHLPPSTLVCTSPVSSAPTLPPIM